MFLAESRERSLRDGVAYGRSLIDYESKKIKKTVLSTSVTELYSVGVVLRGFPPLCRSSRQSDP